MHLPSRLSARCVLAGRTPPRFDSSGSAGEGGKRGCERRGDDGGQKQTTTSEMGEKNSWRGGQDLGLNPDTPSPLHPRHTHTFEPLPLSTLSPPSDLLVSRFAKVSVRLRRSLGLKVCRRAFLLLPRPAPTFPEPAPLPPCIPLTPKPNPQPSCHRCSPSCV